MPIDRSALALARELRARVKGEVRFDPYTRALYSTDASIYQMEPIGLVAPQDVEDVAATMRFAYDSGTPVLPRGGGTSLAGQCVNHAVVMDFSKAMHRVLEVNAEERWVRVQPGISLEQLNTTLLSTGLMFAPDPTTANRATVGGVVGNNSCGAHSLVYGKTVDHVLGMTVVMSDGSVGDLSPTPSFASLQDRPRHGDGLLGRAVEEAVAIAQASHDEVAKRYPKIPRRVSGYNLDELLKSPMNVPGLLVGSEGTLATMVEARLNLVPRPRHTVLGVFHFASLIAAMEGSVWLLQDGERIATIEQVDDTVLRQARTQLALSRRMGFIQGSPAALLAVEIDGDNPDDLRGRLAALAERARRAGVGYACVQLTDRAAQQDVWAVRSAGLGLLMGIRGDAKPIPFVEDTAVPPERLAEFVRRFDALVRREGTTAAYYGHASVGCLHIRPLINLKVEEGVRRMTVIAEGVADLVLEFGGSLSGEHGDGIVRGVFTEKMFGSRLYQAFRDLKRAFDPKGIMNPGKIVDCPPMTENFRSGLATRLTPVASGLDFSADGGFAGAVEQCNGQAACRKLGEGVMCPSFMATREEEHSTRGRANALRAVLSGALPATELTSRRMRDVLDLCLECKACKAECPSNVDMAKLKYAFLEQWHRANGHTLRDLLFANVSALGKWGSATAPVVNALIGSRAGRWALGKAGIAPQREMPRYAVETFRGWFKTSPLTPLHTVERGNVGSSSVMEAQAPARGRRIISPPSPLSVNTERGDGGSHSHAAFFVDTFTNYHEPRVGKAAVAVLERAGYAVTAPETVCCGRPFLTRGMVERAAANARRNVELLAPLAESGVPIVGVEPSCLLMLRDEYLDLLPEDGRARAVAQQAVLFEEFLTRLPDAARARLAFRRAESQVLAQPHCHERALAGTMPLASALRMVPGAEVRVLDAGCCGGAGAFGYEAEHYEVSMRIGERRLFPAVREARGATLVATGFSCREQIAHGAGVRAMSVGEWLAECLV